MSSDKNKKQHRLHANQILHAIQILAQIRSYTQPADAVMHHYFRANKTLGARDRGFIADTVYGVLRQQRSLEYLLDPMPVTAGALVCTYLLSQAGLSVRTMEDAGFHAVDDITLRQLVEHIRTQDRQNMPLSARTNLPDTVLSKLLLHYGEAQTEIIAQGLNQSATLDLRVNSYKANREQVAAALAEENVPAELTPYSPLGLRRAQRNPLNQTNAFKNGWIEVQDEGSQLLTLMLDPQSGEQVVDFCAGAGGKTLQIGAMMQNRGTVYAFDISAKRLDQLKPRLKRSGLSNIRSQTLRDENDVHVKRLRNKMDRVLVDAPCSGLGTVRRNPDIKWRTLDLDALCKSQRSILDAAAKLLKPGGRLVYATCSILPEENEQIIESFIQQHPEFVVVPVNPILEQRKILLTMTTSYLRLWPHEHHTDGFFAAVLQRSADQT